MNKLFVTLAAVTLSTVALGDGAARPAAAAKDGGTPLMVFFTNLVWTELPERKGMEAAARGGTLQLGAVLGGPGGE